MRRLTSHALHLLTEAAIGLAGVLLLAGCALTWRLTQGPLDITWLVQREQTRLAGGAVSLSLGHAALAWEGFRDPDAPLDIRWQDATLSARATGARLAVLPAGRVTLSMLAFLTGRIVPQVVEVDDARVTLVRLASGGLNLDLGVAPGGPPRGGGTGHDVMRALVTPPGPAGSASGGGFLAQLSRVRVRDARITVSDAALGLVWQAQSAAVDLQRLGNGGVQGTARLDLTAGEVRATLTAEAELTASGTHLTARTTPLSPAVLARAVPAFGGLAAMDAPVATELDARLDPQLGLLSARLVITAGAGSVRAGRGAVPIQAATAVLEGSPDHAELQAMRVALAPAAGAPGPVVQARGTMWRSGGRVRADFALDLDQAPFAELARWWPAGTSGGARPWITQNITTGRAHDAHVTGIVEGADDLSDVQLTALAGGFAADDLTAWWLRPVPPIEHAQARVVLDGPDALRVLVDRGQQGRLRIGSGTVRITGLLARDQLGRIDMAMDGPLAGVLALLNTKRLGLLSRRPFEATNPSGTVRADLSVDLPLDDRVTMDDIGIHASARLSDVHLGNVAAGRDLDRAQLALKVDSDSLSITGNGALAGVPASVSVDMDFRNGGPSQVLEHYAASGAATSGELAQAGLPGGIVTGGNAGLSADYADRRDGQGVLQLGMDLRDAVVATPFGWSKPAGAAAGLSARVLLDHGRLGAIEQLRADGPGLRVAGHADIAAGRPRVLRLDRVQLGQTDLHGTIRFPMAPGGRLGVSLAGPVIDATGYLSRPQAGDAPPPDDRKRGQPWAIDAAFDRVILAKDQTVAAVSLRAENDGLHITRATAQAGVGSVLRASIVPVSGGRKLAVDAPDSGAVLLAAGVADNIRGGRLKLDGQFDDTMPHSPLTGTASLSTFRLLDAPAIGRLLKAMTLYGAFDLLRGPGLGFSRAETGFRWQQRVLHLTNARMVSASLGLTAAGDIDLGRHTADVTGTVVPAYFFNQLPGKIPVVGKLFSPEKGGGVFAARYSVRGKLSDPKVGVNALSALTPGFLRGVFGLF